MTPSMADRPNAIEHVQAFLSQRRFDRWLRKAPYDRERAERKKTLGKMGICRWCGINITNGRTSWCSDACEIEYRIRVSSSSVRWQLEQRDHGVCAICGTDVLKNLRLWRDGLKDLHRDYHDFLIVCGICRAMEITWRYRLDNYGWVFDRRYRLRRKTNHWVMARAVRCSCPGCISSFPISWEADHIVPVVEGGGCCGVDNYRTVCICCHKQVTRCLRGKRALQQAEVGG